MKHRRLLAVVAGVLALAMSAAGCGGDEASGPPEVVLGRTECDQCHMIISELRYAGAYRTDGGDERRFDDIGDMVEYAREHDELEDSKFWVFDYESEESVEAPEATFVHSDSLSTPMDSAVAAFADRDEATAFVAESGGEVLSWDEVQDLVSSGQHQPMSMAPSGAGGTGGHS